MMKINKEQLIELFTTGTTGPEMASIFGCNERSIWRALKKLREQGEIENVEKFDMMRTNAQLAKKSQKYQDINRVERKSIRDSIKLENAVAEYNKELVNILKTYKLPKFAYSKRKIANNIPRTGVVHLTDLHFNELVNLPHNKYDFPIASQRLKLFSIRTKQYFKAKGIKNILIAMTGDLMNSDRRLDELLCEATNRSKATFLAVNLLEHFILDLNTEFNVSIANVIGNESRVGDDIGWSEISATDNYDFTIFEILKLLFRDSNVRFFKGDPIEQIVEVSGQNVLLLHGNQLKANSMEQSIQKIKGKYTARKKNIDFVLSGHLHSARVGDSFARGASLVGANAYSDNALQLESRASQNLHVFYKNGTRDSIKVDLQNTNNIKGYNIIKELEAYNAKSLKKSKKKKIVTNIVN